MLISAFCVFRVANKHTFEAISVAISGSEVAAHTIARCSATFSSPI
jgi:hypothetical protein